MPSLVSPWTYDVPTHTTDGFRRASPLWKAAAVSTFPFPAQQSHGRHGGKWGSPNPPLGLIGASCQESVPRPAVLREHQPTRTKQEDMQQEFPEPLLDTQAHASKKGMGETAYTKSVSYVGRHLFGPCHSTGSARSAPIFTAHLRTWTRLPEGWPPFCEHHRGVACRAIPGAWCWGMLQAWWQT